MIEAARRFHKAGFTIFCDRLPQRAWDYVKAIVRRNLTHALTPEA